MQRVDINQSQDFSEEDQIQEQMMDTIEDNFESIGSHVYSAHKDSSISNMSNHSQNEETDKKLNLMTPTKIAN